MTVLGILPAAGMATRMRGLPKFLLPLGDDQGSLLEYHVRLLSPHVERLIVPTRQEWSGLLKNFGLGSKVEIVEKKTETLSQTVIEVLSELDYDSCILGLPDTVFMEGNPYQGLASFDPPGPLVLACFETKPEQRGLLGSVNFGKDGVVSHHADKSLPMEWGTHWGAMRFTPQVLELLPSGSATVGVLIDECLGRGIPVRGFVHDSEYYDCGTVAEYAQSLLKILDSPRSGEPGSAHGKGS